MHRSSAGVRCNVTSIVTDPNADPHEYESSSANAKAVANASLVIVNGAEYDDWASEIGPTQDKSNRTLLNVAALLGKKEGTNPHLVQPNLLATAM